MLIITVDKSTFEIFTCGLSDKDVVLSLGVNLYAKLDENYMPHYKTNDSTEGSKMIDDFLGSEVAVIDVKDIKGIKNL